MEPSSASAAHNKRPLFNMFARVTFIPTLAYNIFMERVSSRNWWDRIDRNVVLGALPFRGHTAKRIVEEENVRAVISMNETYELALLSYQHEEWAKLGVKFLQLPTTDIFEAPSQEKLLQGVRFIRDVIDADEACGERSPSVYVHCKAGRTRSATLVGCHLMLANNWTPEQAVAFMKERRPHVLLHTAQWQALNEFYTAQVLKQSQTSRGTQ